MNWVAVESSVLADSKGGFFNRCIRNHFRYRQAPRAELHRELNLFFEEIGHARIRRTEVRPICSRRAISALLIPARYSFHTLPA